ncbi:hypothetical protein C8R47DRAFT_1226175 [Mycena vitilis]|nr:hypothetical protein C8R47DRAFT_1226175 [Mycena vitilis]
MHATTALTTVDTIRAIHERFQLQEALYSGFLDAFIFPTGGENRILVRVPIKVASNLVNNQGVDYMSWIATDDAHPLSNLSFVDMDVFTGAEEHTRFTVFAPDQVRPFGVGTLNHPLSAWVTAATGISGWRGNILVMRRNAVGELVSVRDSDGMNAKVRPVIQLMPWNMHREAWMDALRFLRTAPNGPDARRVLSAFNAEQLFRASMVSAKLYQVVAEYLDYLKDSGVESDDDDSDSESSSGSPQRLQALDFFPPAPCTLDTLPAEVGHTVLRDLDFADRLRFARVSRSAALTAAHALQAAAIAVLVPFDLRFGEIRLLQTVTGAVISGSSIPAVMCPARPFSPSELDIYTARGGGWDAVGFLEKSGKYGLAAVSSAHNFQVGVRKVWTMRHNRTRKKVNVIESLTKNPLDVIAHFPSTCVFGAWTARGLWHAYPLLTMAGSTMTTCYIRGGGD